jgi:ATP-binding cassette subfamily F protein 3
VATKLIVFDNDTVSVFEGTYFDFLERVGWSDEGGVRVKKGKKQASEQNGSRKDAKKQRSAIMNDRSRVLGPLKKKIAALEDEITKLEYEVDQDNQRLLEVSIKGKALDIKRLSQAVRDNKARIDARFAELQAVTNEHDAKEKEFEQQLEELAQPS